MRHTYTIDIKVYEEELLSVIPFIMPAAMCREDRLKAGTRSHEFSFTEQEFDEFCFWVSEHEATLKIIGTTKHPSL